MKSKHTYLLMIRLQALGSQSCAGLSVERQLVVRNARCLCALGWLSVCTAFAWETGTLNSRGSIRKPTVPLDDVEGCGRWERGNTK